MRTQALRSPSPAQKPLAGRNAVHRAIKRSVVTPMAARNDSSGENKYIDVEISPGGCVLYNALNFNFN